MARMNNRALIATEVLDDEFGYTGFHERVGENISDAVDRSLLVYKDYGYTEEELPEFIMQTVTNTIWDWYTGGDTCRRVAERIVKAWEDAGVNL